MPFLSATGELGNGETPETDRTHNPITTENVETDGTLTKPQEMLKFKPEYQPTDIIKQ